MCEPIRGLKNDLQTFHKMDSVRFHFPHELSISIRYTKNCSVVLVKPSARQRDLRNFSLTSSEKIAAESGYFFCASAHLHDLARLFFAHPTAFLLSPSLQAAESYVRIQSIIKML